MSVRIQHEDFDIAAEVSGLKQSGTNAGAIATFTGIVRSGDGIQSLTLEHYPGMTEREIARHINEAKNRWPGIAVRVIHRVGTLAPGDNIVFAGVAASHRKAAFEAAEFLMDYLKTRAPFWKQERRDGSADWVEARQSDEAALRRWQRED